MTDSKNLTEAKKRCRKTALNNRRALSPEQRASFSQSICEKISGTGSYREAKNILVYSAAFDEVCLDHLIKAAEASGKRAAYPCSMPEGIMKAFVPGEGGLNAGKYGIMAPDPATSEEVCPEELDLIIVPCVGFDEEGHRLGHGGGYYDRYIPLCKKAKLLCAAFEAQKLETVPAGGFDVPMELIVTESAVYRPLESPGRKE